MKKYKLVAKKGEGTFSEVVKAESIDDGNFYAIKCMKKSFKNLAQVNNLREIQALRKLTPHPHIVDLEEVLFDEPSGRLAIVFELMDANLYDLISGRRNHLDSDLVRSIGYQIFTALKYMHDRSIFHRDIKPENILIDKERKTVKLADFGSCRSIHSEPPFTEYIATRWYRSPECLLTEGHYGAPMDIWGVGCVLFEMTSLCPLFPGADEVDQINRIHKVVGTPSRETLLKLRKHKSGKINFHFRDQKGVGIRDFIPHAPIECVHLIDQTLKYDVVDRIRSPQALEHKYFDPLRFEDNLKFGLAAPSSKSIRYTFSTDSRNELSSVRLSRGIGKAASEDEQSVKRKVYVGGRADTRKLVKAKPKPKPKMNKTTTKTAKKPTNKPTNKPAAKPTNKPAAKPTNKPAAKPTNKPAAKPTAKPTNKPERKPANPKKVQPTQPPPAAEKKKKMPFRSRLRFNRSKSIEEPKRANRPFKTRLPSIDSTCMKNSKSNNMNKKTEVKTSVGMKQTENLATKRNKKYSNVSSSGYGKTDYKPLKPNLNNPSATSSLTDKTSKTGTSTYMSSKSLTIGDNVKENKKSTPNSHSKKKLGSKRESTLSKLPAVQ